MSQARRPAADRAMTATPLPDPILVTRPRPAADALADRLAAIGRRALLCPVSRIVPVADPAPAHAMAALIATSANAFLTPLPAHLGGLACYCVGAATAAAAEAAGLTPRAATAGDAAGLARAILADRPAGPLLYLAGEPRKPDLEAALAEAGRPVTIWRRYRAVAVDHMPAPAATALDQGPATVLFYSERAVGLFVDLLKTGGRTAGGLVALSLSPKIAKKASFDFTPSLAAPDRSEDALLSVLSAV